MVNGACISDWPSSQELQCLVKATCVRYCGKSL